MAQENRNPLIVPLTPLEMQVEALEIRLANIAANQALDALLVAQLAEIGFTDDDTTPAERRERREANKENIKPRENRETRNTPFLQFLQ